MGLPIILAALDTSYFSFLDILFHLYMEVIFISPCPKVASIVSNKPE